jgi:hypothetical protein
MRLWVVVWSVVAAIVALFTIANWSVLTAPTTISLIVTEVSGPLGLMMLGMMAGLTLLFLIFLLWVETKAIVQMPKAGARPGGEGTAAQAAEIRTELERQLGGLRADSEHASKAVLARLDRVEQTVRDEVGRVGQHLAAQPGRSEPPR